MTKKLEDYKKYFETAGDDTQLVMHRGYALSLVRMVEDLENSKAEDRKVTLLKACIELLKKQENSSYVLNLLSETVHYDDADCDGNCLMDDIKIELGL